MRAISNEHGFALWAMVGKMIRGWCLGMSGQAAEGIEHRLGAGSRAVEHGRRRGA